MAQGLVRESKMGNRQQRRAENVVTDNAGAALPTDNSGNTTIRFCNRGSSPPIGFLGWCDVAMMATFARGRSMRVSLIALLAVLAVFNSGCFLPLIQHRADTVLAVRQTDPQFASAIPMGFRRTDFKQYDDGFVIQGSGGLPREHETFVYLYLVGSTADSLGDHWRRVRITCRDTEELAVPQDCRIQVLLQQGWPKPKWTDKHEYEAYEGEARLQFGFDAETVSTEFSDVKLVCPMNPNGTIYVSGKVVGKRPGEHRDFFARKAKSFDEDWAKAARATTQPTPPCP